MDAIFHAFRPLSLGAASEPYHRVPEPDDLHPGPHKVPLCLETRDITIDAWGWYDGETGALDSVEIDGRHIRPELVQTALDALGHADYTRWSRPLSAAKLSDLSDEAGGLA